METLRQCGVLSIEYWFHSGQLDCSLREILRQCGMLSVHIVVPLQTSWTSLIEILRQCGVLGIQYWFHSVQLD